jgi:hypothetical protein
MSRLNINDARCKALFASSLQRSDAPTPEVLTEVISQMVRRFGIAGCTGRVAQEFGDHPESAASRMRWIRQLIGQAPAPAAPRPATPALEHGPRVPRPATASVRQAA